MSTRIVNQSADSATTVSRVVARHPCSDETAGNVIIPVLEARKFSFDGIDASSSLELVVADEVDVTGFVSAYLAVRLHEATIGTGPKIEVIAYVSAPSREDPSQSFRSTTEAANVSFTSVTLSSPGGVLDGMGLAGELGPSITVAVRGTQGSSPDECTGVISADLVLKRRPAEHIGGARLTVLPRTELDYTSLAPSTSDSKVLVRALDVSKYRTGYLALRVHERSIDTGASMTIRIHGALPDAGDPSTSYVVPTASAEHTFTIAAGTTSELQTVVLPSNFGPFLYVHLQATQSGTGGDLEASVSLDFVGQQ